MIVTEYDRKFVRLSQYDRECVSTEAIMCKIFEDGLNDEIRVAIAALKLRKFELSERAQKVEEICKSKRQLYSKSREYNKRGSFKLAQTSPLKKFRSDTS